MILERLFTKNPYATDGRFIIGSDLDGFFLHSVGCAGSSALSFIERWDNVGFTGAGISGFIDPSAAYITAPCLKNRGKVKRMPHGGRPYANNHYIGFEMCEPSQMVYDKTTYRLVGCTDRTAALAFVRATYQNAVELFARLCLFHGRDPLADGVILSHYEAGRRGIATGHIDPEHLWNYLQSGLTMAGFRQDVKNTMEELRELNKAETQALIQAAVKPIRDELNTLKESVAKHVTPEQAKRIYLALAKEGFVTEISDAPAWAKPELRVLLDAGAINGGTDADVNPNDVNMPIEDVKVALICKRYVDHALGNK
jgi:hypothetical protein